jgi:prephenate dehydratase
MTKLFARDILTLGPSYSWSDIATREYIKENSLTSDVERLTPINRSEGVIEALVSRYDFGLHDSVAIVPIYNTLEGRVKDTLNPGRGLLRYTQIKIYDEYILDISHCLAAKKKSSKIRTIISHPQALMQCNSYVRSIDANTREASSTAEAATIVAQSSANDLAAICPEEAAKEYGLEIIARDIQNTLDESSVNKTIFVVLWHKDHEPTERDKTTITFELKDANRPGTLFRAIKIFADSNINLSKVESMEKGYLTDYVFWFNVDEHQKKMETEIRQLHAISKKVLVHGSYPKRTP